MWYNICPELSVNFTNLNGNFSVPCMHRMMLDENKKCGETETRIDGEVSWEQDTLHFSKRVSWQCEVQGQTYNIPKKGIS